LTDTEVADRAQEVFMAQRASEPDEDRDLGTADGARSSTARRIIAGAQLRRLREREDISRAEAGYLIRASESKISRLELGKVSFKERDVEDLLGMYGIAAGDPERERFMELVRRANDRGWWTRYSDLMPTWFNDYVGLEESASRLQVHEMQFVPGLLQTEDYARALAQHGKPDSVRHEVDRRVELRMGRQRVLTGPNPPRVWAVIDESVLHRPIGGTPVLLRQLEHLLELIKLPNVALQVVPFSLPSFAAECAFTILRFSEQELPDVVYLEHLGGASYLDKLDEIELYSRAADRLAVDALTPDDTKQLLNKTRSELRAD
jgi:transcriptional regulator with XRE-family HTH domain